jgi:hypothetical protein
MAGTSPAMTVMKVMAKRVHLASIFVCPTVLVA